MDLELISVLTFAFVATLLVISPGPNGILIGKSVASSGKAAGYLNIVGFVAAFFVHGTLSIFGMSIILVQSADAFFVFKILGAIYLCWLGIKSIKSAFSESDAMAVVSSAKQQQAKSKVKSKANAVLEGFLTNVLNPKVSMFYLAAFPQFISLDDNIMQAYMLVIIHALINIIWFVALVALFARLAEVKFSKRLIKAFKSLSGAIFIGFGAKLATIEN